MAVAATFFFLFAECVCVCVPIDERRLFVSFLLFSTSRFLFRSICSALFISVIIIVSAQNHLSADSSRSLSLSFYAR